MAATLAVAMSAIVAALSSIKCLYTRFIVKSEDQPPWACIKASLHPIAWRLDAM